MKRLIQRVAALTAALCVAAACVAPVYAETANTEKEENVYVSLAGDGSVADIYIVNMFALDGKNRSFRLPTRMCAPNPAQKI